MSHCRKVSLRRKNSADKLYIWHILAVSNILDIAEIEGRIRHGGSFGLRGDGGIAG